MSRRKSRLRAGAMLVMTLALVACQPSASEFFIISNETDENVVVRWNDGNQYASLPPGKSKEAGYSPANCRHPPLPVEKLTATTESGKRYIWDRPLCPGKTWHIRETPKASPS